MASMKRHSWVRAAARSFELTNIEGSRFFAEDVFTGGESLEAEIGVGVGMGGDIDGVDLRGEQGFEGGRNRRDRKLIRIGIGAIGFAAPDGSQIRIRNSFESLGETCSGATRTDDPEANVL